MRTLILILLISTLFNCNKEPSKQEPVVLSGRIIQDCGLQPLANANINLEVIYSANNTWGYNVFFQEFKADSNGYFWHKFTIPSDGYYCKLTFYGGGIDSIFNWSNKNFGNIIAEPTVNFVTKLKINNPYQLGDTLYIHDYSIKNNIKIPAPLKDTIFNNTYNYPLKTLYTPEIENFVEISANYFIYDSVLYRGFYNRIFEKQNKFRIPSCNANIDTIVIEID